MRSEWQEYMVRELQEIGQLLVEDGNHGEYRPRRDEFCKEGTVFIRAADMDRGRVLFDSASKINGTAVARIHKGIGVGGDVLPSHKGTVGKLAMVPLDALPFVCSPQTTFWRSLNHDTIDRRYLYAYMHSPNFRQQLDSRKGETDMADYVSLTAQREFSVLLPPIADQRAIAHILGSLDDKIELNQRMNETLEAMARAIFKSWFVDFDPVRAKAEGRDTGLPEYITNLFPDSFEELEVGAVPEGWKQNTIRDEFNLTMGQSPPGSTYNETGEGHPFFQGRRDFGFRYPKNRVYCTAPKRIAERSDTLVSVRAPVGAINMAAERCCIGRGVAGIRHKSGSRSYTYYAMHTLRNHFNRFEAEGTVFGAINKKQFEAIIWIAPPTLLVERFEQIAFPFDERIESNERESTILAALRDTLLPKLISGELRVPDAEKFIEATGL
jgi:type I restriction enzyme S subunit